MKVLVVEDYIESADALREFLAIQDYESRVAHSGGHALSLVENWCPDVVLLDVGLPDMSGWQVAMKIAELCSETPPVIIVVSAFEPDPDMLRAVGVRWYIKKPADLAVLRSLLEPIAKAAKLAEAKASQSPRPSSSS